MAVGFLSRVPGEGGAAPGAEIYAFGPFELDIRRHVLTRDGRPVALTPKGFELLLILARSGGRALPRQELVAALWPDTFVEEGNLSYQVSLLRKALGDARPDSQAKADPAEAWIETVPKVGYRFTADVAVRAITHRRQTPASRIWLTAASLVSIAGLLVWIVASSRGRHVPRYGTTAVPLTAYPGWEGSPSFSPDGTQVAFEWTGASDTPDIYVKLVGQGEPVRLTTDPRYELGPAWSPDGRRVAYLREPEGTGSAGVHPDYRDLMVVPALGGTVREIMPLTVFTAPLDHRGMNLLSWTPDGRWIAAGARIEGTAGLWLVEVDGPGRRLLLEPPPQFFDHSPRISADGQRLAFVRVGPTSPGALFVLPLGAGFMPIGPPSEIVNPAPRYVGSLAWGADQASVLYSVGAHGAMSRLELVRLGSRRLSSVGLPEPLPFGDQATGLDVAPSGRVVYVRRQRDTGFWSLDPASPAAGMTALSQFESSFDEWAPHHAPDGRRLVFVSSRSGTSEIWIANIDGTNPRQMTTIGGAGCMDPQWAPDARLIVFSSTAAGSWDLYLLDPVTSGLRALTSDPGWEVRPRWSRDGRSIYYSANRGGSGPGIWKVSPHGGEPVAVGVGEGMMAQESPDGHSLYVTRPHQPALQLWRVPVNGDEPSLLADDLAMAQNVVVGRQAVYYLAVGPPLEDERVPAGSLSVAPRPGMMAWSLAAIDPVTRTRTTLGRVGLPWPGIALSPDGHQLIATVRNAETLDLMLVDPPP